jgi:hypothetical protein
MKSYNEQIKRYGYIKRIDLDGTDAYVEHVKFIKEHNEL